ncbi:MAG: hypothetical protein IJ755_04525 [Bacteroidales bacterium]|nr:hypothetical protein [Bacteroidales bacterium]MBR1794545.1 hypothetical protein [Bacteroidales bacterium]
MENEIKTFFHEAAPQPADDATFRLELNARLAAVERVRQFHDEETHFARQIVLVVFIAGLIIGGLFAAIAILHPGLLKQFWVALSNLSEWNSTMFSKDGLFFFLAILAVLLSFILTLVIFRSRSWRA